MNRYKGIIFDLDGTLLDTIADLGDSMNEVLEGFNRPTYTYEEYKLKVGGGFRGLVLKCFPEENDEEKIDEIVRLYYESYSRNYLNKTTPYREIEKVLYKLNQRGYKLAINSNKGDEYTNKLVNRFFPKIPFIEIYGERVGIPRKPAPTGALEIARSMKLETKDILYVGDTKTDIMTAKNAGMDSAGVLWGFRNREELSRYGANFIISNPEEILDIV